MNILFFAVTTYVFQSHKSILPSALKHWYLKTVTGSTVTDMKPFSHLGQTEGRNR